MFTASGQLHLNVPQFDTRRALIVLNLQNDALFLSGELAVTEPPGFVDKIKTLVPCFRKTGDIAWVRTECTSDRLAEAQPSSGLNAVEETRPELPQVSRHVSYKDQDETDTDERPSQPAELTTHCPSSLVKDSLRRASAQARAEEHEAYQIALQNLDSSRTRPVTGQSPLYFQPGTYGAAIVDDVLPLVDEVQDLLIAKPHYSAFEGTPLLLSLRMKLVTDLYLCGCLSNVSIYATAADAVKHGFSVTVVEDCIGYRCKARHETALRQMEDIMGAYGITSGELITEMNGAVPPDTESTSCTNSGLSGVELQSLSLGKESSVSGNGASIPTQADSFNEEALPKSQALPQVEATQSSQAVAYSKTAIAGVAIPTPILSSARVDQANREKARAVSDREEAVSVVYDGGMVVSGSKRIKSSHRQRLGSKLRMPIMGPNDVIGEGDSLLVLDILPPSLNENAFGLLRTEVQWKSMHHRSGDVPRLVAVQGKMDEDGSTPIYRHPADESPPLSPFSPLMEKIRVQVQKSLNQPMNHALIQLYRNGEDNISEHSDKTLDIVRGSSIVNVSIGAQRVMTLRTKKTRPAHDTESPSATRKVQRIAMPTNSMFVLGPRTNMRWLHGVRADKRLAIEKSDEERAFGGERISITFRHIGTFMNEKDQTIWGQGARFKQKPEAAKIRNTDNAEMEAMVVAFGRENHQPDFDWDAEYGHGFDVIDLVSKSARLFLCDDHIRNRRVKLSLIEKGVLFETVLQKDSPASRPLYISHSPHALAGTQYPRFKDTDEEKSEVDGDLAILYYLENFHPFTGPETTATAARLYSRTTQSDELLFLWRDVKSTLSSADPKNESSRQSASTRSSSPNLRTQEFRDSLKIWEDFAGDTEFIAGAYFTVTDCAFWPVLNEIVTEWAEWSERRYPDLAAYHQRLAQRESVKSVMHEA
ncbi:Oxoglutarate/iron-dependent dioxygenase [Lasallia pustulata]|uniref:Oxoglutarate/iron-dependent dioxygenase n=1 Tax=Lasallia pustulata TaxID=136370 RepID=A0A1W5CZS8_9LECA|nr:Oxoglutarate/iron-dependent dioxygenase [Lasallia pustulata]